MAENTVPKKNVAYTFYVALISTANRPDCLSNPTLATSDVKVSTDGGAFGDAATLPVVTPAMGVAVKVDLSASEMNGDNVTVKFVDMAGAEWDDLFIEIRPATRRLEDLAWPTTTLRSIDVAATGEVGMDFGNATGSITGGELGVGAFAASAITAAAIATGAIDADSTAADYLAEIRVEAAGALSDVQLDHLLHVADASTTTTNSILAKMAASDGVFSGFSAATDSLEAIRANTAWDTATGFSTHSAADVWTSGTRTLTGIGTGIIDATSRNEIADSLLLRDVDNVETSANEHTVCTIVLAMLESSITGTTWTITQTDGLTTHATKTVTVDASADPITGVT